MQIRFVNCIFLVSLIFFSLAVPVMSQMGGPDMGNRDDDRGRWSASDMMEQGRNLRHGEDISGMGFMRSNEARYGQYITFKVDDQTGVISEYGIDGHEIFDTISVERFDLGQTEVVDALTRIVDSDGTTMIQVHDNPAAVINIISSDAITVKFDLADGVAAVKEDDMIRISTVEIIAYITYSADSEITISGGTVTIVTPANSSIVFRALPVNIPGQGELHRMLTREIANNRVGADIYLGMNGSHSIVNYSEKLQIRLETMTRDRIRLRVSSTDPQGQILAFNLDNTSLVLRERDRLRIHLDNRTLQCVNNSDEFFNATGATCLISQQTRDRIQLLVHVPEFSDHFIDIIVESEGTPAASPSPGVPGFGILIAAAGLWLVYMIKRQI